MLFNTSSALAPSFAVATWWPAGAKVVLQSQRNVGNTGAVVLHRDFDPAALCIGGVANAAFAVTGVRNDIARKLRDGGGQPGLVGLAEAEPGRKGARGRAGQHNVAGVIDHPGHEGVHHVQRRDVNYHPQGLDIGNGVEQVGLKFQAIY